MKGVCAWCRKDLSGGQHSDQTTTSHGICEECFLDLRVRETVKRLREGPGPFALFVPPNREDLVLRIQRQAPRGVLLIIRPDRRQGERRTRGLPVTTERRLGDDRRSPNLSFVAARPPEG